jgi:hypothetical protein
MLAYGLRIIEQTASLEPECEGDKMLIEAFMQNGYKGKELRELNRCRLYLQCTNLADITNGKGNKILAAIQCHRSALIEQKQYEWPTQPAPNQLQKLLWRKAMDKCFSLHHRTNVLRQPLGTWHSPPIHLIRYDLANRVYYVPTGDGRWQQVQKDALRLQQDPTWTTLQITSEEPRPQSIMKGTYTNGKIESFGMRLVQWQDTSGPDIQARMNQLGELRWSVQNLQIQGDLIRLLQTIEDGTAYSGTDGSYKDGHGTAAFRIQNDLADQITGCNITPGLQEHQLAYRSELGGIVGILVLLDLLHQHYDLRIPQKSDLPPTTNSKQ